MLNSTVKQGYNKMHDIKKGGPEWRVTYSPTHICALEGSSVSMSCSYTYPSYLRVKEAFWTNQYEYSVNSDLSKNVIYKRRVTLDSKNKHRECSLNMIQLTKADQQYQYYCRITTNVDNQKMTGIPGISLKITDLQIVSTSEERVTEGDHVTLTCKTICTLTGSPSFIWRKDGRPVERNINNQLQLRLVSREDEGNYTCAVRGHEGLPSPRYRLQVMYPPKNTTTVSAPSGEITVGTRVTLTCMSEADPPVHTYTWIKKSGAVELKSGKENTLTFSKIRSEDSGEYLCRADNTIGHQNSPAVSIKVLYPPNNTTIVSDPSGEIPDGGNVTLTCMSEADPPVHTYTWIKKSGAVELKSGKENTLTFSKIRSEDSGEYLCRAANTIGQQDSPAVSVRVLYPPRNTRVVSAPSGEITEGTRVTLTCMSEAAPPVHTYTWIKKSGAVELESGKENTLTFSRISSEDSGEYLCRAANRIGQQNSSAVPVQVLSMSHDRTILIAVLAGVAVCVGVALLCVMCRLRQSKNVATNSNRTPGDENHQDDDVLYATIDFKRSGQSRAAGHLNVAAAGGAEDDVQYSTIQPHGSTQTAGGAEDDVQYSTIQPHGSRQTAGAQGDDDVQYSSVHFKKAAGVKGSPDQPEGELSVIYSSVHMRA
ncbi:B-cell receptor CD22-like isoform X2 [Alosa sapidissima]|uniref:B-cell receptor CD22-like isoform X2 n=1 Tax=Alosa sapidissima TaxID=34773 RepID=UPI001C08C664|nr:B-cell receptor CD22-like isoform X2 [Alosa sapidissima]